MALFQACVINRLIFSRNGAFERFRSFRSTLADHRLLSFISFMRASGVGRISQRHRKNSGFETMDTEPDAVRFLRCFFVALDCSPSRRCPLLLTRFVTNSTAIAVVALIWFTRRCRSGLVSAKHAVYMASSPVRQDVPEM